MNKYSKLALCLILSIQIVGCVSHTGLAREQVLSNKKEGYLYGVDFAGIGSGTSKTTDIVEICKAISNADSRCANPYNYGSFNVLSNVGFADGPMGAIAVYDKNVFNIKNSCSFASSSSCHFYGVEVSIGKLPTLTKEVDGVCLWSGSNGVGGTVCKTLNWDYKKDNSAAIFF